MGISNKVCSANKVEIKELKTKISKITSWRYKYPGQLTRARRMDFAISMNNMSERIEYLRRDKHANLRREIAEGEEPDFDFTYVLKKRNVKNRKL